MNPRARRWLLVSCAGVCAGACLVALLRSSASQPGPLEPNAALHELASTSPVPGLVARAEPPSQWGTETVADSPSIPIAAVFKPVRDSAGSKASVTVRVVSSEEGAPLQGVHVHMYTRNEDSPGASFQGATEMLTDTEGVAMFETEANTGLYIAASGNSQRASNQVRQQTPLPPGSNAEVRIALLTKPNHRIHGLVVSDADGTPIEGARITEQHSLKNGWQFPPEAEESPDQRAAGAATTSDAVGHFEIDTSSWRKPYLRIDAEGWATEFLAPRADKHDVLAVLSDLGLTPRPSPREESVTIRMKPAAKLVLRLANETGSTQGGLGFRLTAEIQEGRPAGVVIDGFGIPTMRPCWKAAAREGVAEFETLPIGVPIQIEILQGFVTLRREVDPVVLTAGEERELMIPFGSGATIRGRVLDERGVPVRMLRLELVDVGSDGHEGRGGFDSVQVRNGSFALEDVPPGEWRFVPYGAEQRKHMKLATTRNIEPDRVSVLGSGRIDVRLTYRP